MENQSSDLIGQRSQRLSKVKVLRSLGIDPYPAKSYKSHTNIELVNEFETLENKEVVVAGRLLSWRAHGKLIFVDIYDDTGKIQVYIKSDEIITSEFAGGRSLTFEEFNLIDVGDFIEVHGTLTRTQRGEISVLARNVRMLTKVLRPLPTELIDKEERFRRRYVDMVVNPEVRERMKRRALFWEAHREFFNKKGFYEVNIPVLEHVPGGGDAVPFTTQMNALDQDFFLRISHELPLKRLVGGGIDKVYDIGVRFRNEGLSDEHLPEHVAMEFYWAYADWRDGMKLIQELYTFIIDKVYGGRKVFKIRGFEVDFNSEWEILDFNQIMKERYGIKDLYSITIEEVKELLQKNNIEFDRSVNIARGVDALWKKIRKTIGGPAFLINHPKYLSPLQKASLENSNMVERFQPIIAGSELGNGWSEVNDAVDQYERFVEQQKLRDAGDAEAQWLDIDYVEMLEYGMPPTFGYGHAERVFWFLEDVTAKEGVPFPQLKSELDPLTIQIYGEEIVELTGHQDTSDSGKVDTEELEEVISTGEITTGLKEESNLTVNSKSISREESLQLLNEYIKNPSLLNHSKMVAHAMESYAKELNLTPNEVEEWWTAGLLHDLDWEMYPDEHPNKAVNEILALKGYSESILNAIRAHAPQRTGKNADTPIERYLFACDEISGFINAVSLVRPTHFIGMEAKSVIKRLKEPKFAANVSREDINEGASLISKSLDDHAGFLVKAFQGWQS